MSIHTFHLVELNPTTTTRAWLRPPTAASAPGLRHAECLATMQLGAATISPARMQLHRMAMFAEWESECAVDEFLSADGLGSRLASGWHVRLEFLRRWGAVAAMAHLAERAGPWDSDEPVVAVTLARLKLPQVPRFVKWGKPVERLVRDHPGVTLALAAMRPPRTVATFSVWRSVQEMTAMVQGSSAVPEPRRHAAAMAERDRKDFHHEFTTLRFRVLSEHGAWQGRRHIVPTGRR